MSDSSVVDDGMAKKVEGRKRRVLWGYRSVALSYAASSGLALRRYGVTPSSCYTVAGPLLAAGVAHVLSGAAQNNRLGSNTYKRLNIVLAKYAAIGMICAALARKMCSFWTALSFVAMVNSIKGFGYGVKGWKLEGGMKAIKDDLRSETKSVAKSVLSVPPNLQSTVYLAATCTVLALNINELFEIAKLLSVGSDAVKILPRLSYCARFLLLAGTSFTLKDAADRGRLEGSTFIELNFLSSLVFGTFAAYLRSAAGIMTGLARVTTFFSAMTFIFGGMGWRYKKKKEKYHDRTLMDERAERLTDDFPLEE